MNCRQVEDLAPLYVAGALRKPDVTAFEAHVAACPLHEESLVALREVAYAHAGGFEDVSLPPSLKDRIMAAVREDAARTPRPAKTPSGWLRPRLAFAGVAAVLVLALAAFLTWDLALRSDSSTHHDTFAIALQGPGGASGTYHYTEGQEGSLSVRGLPSLPADQAYLVWASANGYTWLCGRLTVPASGLAFARMQEEMPRDARIFVTVEAAGGSTYPTGATVLSNR